MRSTRYLLVFAVLMLVVAAGAVAQTTANLTGTVLVSGSPLPGATVTISSPNLQGSRAAYTDVNGNYNFGGLPPGTYTVRFEMESMQTATRTVQLGLSTTTRADTDLKLTAMADSITVTAGAPAVLETTEVQSNISAKLIENLPIGRTLLATANLAPGVSTNGPAGATMISGAQSFDSTFYVDGAVVNEVLRGQPQNLFIEDAIQETTVQAGAISAEYGRFTGGVVTAISKSGGNDFSGSLRDSGTNPTWTSQGELKEARPASKIQNTYEGTLGGRIIRDRLWFFLAGRDFDRNAQQFLTAATSGETLIPFTAGTKERRVEGKLTGQLSAKHSLTGSYLDVRRNDTNACFIGCLEPITLDASNSTPNNFATLAYNGIVTNNFLIEGIAAKQRLAFVGSGAEAHLAPEVGTNIEVVPKASFAGFPTFCGGCPAGTEHRDNHNYKLKGSYFLSSKSLGTHDITGGGEDYRDMLKANNYQSASDFTIFTFNNPGRDPSGNLLLNMNRNSGFVIWFPILAPSKGNDFTTRSAFVNDKWDVNGHLNLNVGVRYDHNTGQNEAHDQVANDSKVSPRLGLIYDIFGNGRLRVNASYSQYVSKIANGNVGDVTSPSGSPSLLYWIYGGPSIRNATTAQFLQQTFAWFNSVGGTQNTDFLLGGGTSGIQTQIRTQLKSPGVNEWTTGLGGRVGTNGFLRADVQYRKWNNFYTQTVTQANGTVFDPLIGQNVDLNLVQNSNDFTRTYRALLMQGGYKFLNRINLGANWTYAKLRGNVTGETSGSGPVTSNASNTFYPEFNNFADNNPVGFLNADQRNKIRAWASLDVPTFLGNFNFSVLQRYDSGTPYSAVGQIFNVGGDNCPTCPQNTFGYVSVNPGTTSNYYFGPRGQFRTDNITATDVAVNYFLPISKAQIFIEGELINAFNRQGVVNVDTTVDTASTDPTLLTFNPFATKPVQGLNYRLGPDFGKPLNPTTGATAGDFQQPRTYRVSVGVRF
jgi:outer membrane receptor protein involved in Fe transport